MEFNLAGITSSGYSLTKEKRIHCGEQNTFTTFTRVSLFTEWIEEMKLNSTNDIEILFRLKCPGVLCRSNNRCVRALDGIVDCLDGEDETY